MSCTDSSKASAITPPDRIPISALQHYVYCPRQCALIHVEQTFEENLYTLRGRRAHANVHDADHDMIAGVRVERGLPLFAPKLGLTGVADVVEFLKCGTPYPVEYKAGPRQRRQADEVQLCAQAMCIEEMLSCTVPEGSLYYKRSRRRRRVKFSADLRSLVNLTVRQVRTLFEDPVLPAPVDDSRCDACSLLEACLPSTVKDWPRRRLNPFQIRD